MIRCPRACDLWVNRVFYDLVPLVHIYSVCYHGTGCEFPVVQMLLVLAEVEGKRVTLILDSKVVELRIV